MPRLAVLDHERPAVTTHLDRDAVTVGRATSSDLLLADGSVSRNHGRFRRTDLGWTYEDLGSRHGSLVNGRRVTEPVLLEPGDHVTVGSLIVVFDPPIVEPARLASTPPSHAREARSGFVGDSAAMRQVREIIRRFAPSTASVLISGETGTGKELVAQGLHADSPRASGPFVVVNCPALPGSLVEAELFGTERGVATGVDPRPGLLEAADRGTLFLDEVGDLEIAAQAKLLRFLQERTVSRLGARTAKPLDVRIVAATHHDLSARVAEGTFRRDLFHRLEVATIHVPPLRARMDDLPVLVAHLLAQHGPQRPLIADDAFEAMRQYDWPGNVRELEHALHRAVLLAADGIIRRSHLPRAVRGDSVAPADSSMAEQLHRRVVQEGGDFWTLVREPFLRRDLPRAQARAFVARALAEAGGSYRQLARLLRVEPDYRRLVDFLRNNALRPEDAQGHGG